VAAPPPTEAPRAAAPPAATPAPAPAAQPAPSTALPPHRDPQNAIFRERLVHFDFDSYLVRPSDQPMIERHARYLTTAPQLTLRIEGHADERGGSEYNLALGMRRADSVRRALALLGVANTRIEIVSWGEERPAAPDHDEASWEQNRRAEIIYVDR
jgi:peptidoglycan-associated lipoprotein